MKTRLASLLIVLVVLLTFATVVSAHGKRHHPKPTPPVVVCAGVFLPEQYHCPRPYPTYTQYPTYTALPTYTPYPTYTQPVPTASPTAKPALSPWQRTATSAALYRQWCPVGVCVYPTKGILFPPPLY